MTALARFYKRLGEIGRTKKLQHDAVPPALALSKAVVFSMLRLPRPFLPAVE
jgi:hypothetical protein